MAAHSKVSEKNRIFPMSSAVLYSTMKRVSRQQSVEKIHIHDLRRSTFPS